MSVQSDLMWPPIIHRHEQLALQGNTKSFETLVKLRMLAQKDGPRAVAEDEEIGDLATNYDMTYIVKRENRGDRSLEVLVHERCIRRRFTSAQSGAASKCGRDVIGTGGLCYGATKIARAAARRLRSKICIDGHIEAPIIARLRGGHLTYVPYPSNTFGGTYEAQGDGPDCGVHYRGVGRRVGENEQACRRGTQAVDDGRTGRASARGRLRSG
jgi:hypothetical protein